MVKVLDGVSLYVNSMGLPEFASILQSDLMIDYFIDMLDNWDVHIAKAE